MLEQTFIPPALGVFGLVCAFIVFALVKRYEEGDENLPHEKRAFKASNKIKNS